MTIKRIIGWTLLIALLGGMGYELLTNLEFVNLDETVIFLLLLVFLLIGFGVRRVLLDD